MSNRQLWQYAYIHWWTQGLPTTSIHLRYLSPEEKGKSQDAKPGGFFSHDPDYDGIFSKWINELGQEGYEMIGFATKETGNNYKLTEYWFKRHKQI